MIRLKTIKIVLLILCLVTILISITGCSTAIDGVIITKYPDRLVYVAGYDTELDLTGGEIVMLLRDFTRRYMEIESMDGWASKLIRHEIDFNVPGTYIVTVYNAMLSDNFAIQVVAKDYVDNIINQQ